MARILIVDDNLLCRPLLSEILSGAGHDIVGEATDGLQAPTLVRDLRPDIVTLDLVMPRRGGLATLQHLRMLDHTQSVLLSAAFPTAWQINSALRLGAKGIIIKPFDREAVLNVVRNVLTDSGARQAVPPVALSPVVAEPVVDEHVDQREFIRVSVALRVVLSVGGRSDQLHTFTMNLSGSGMLLAIGGLSVGQYV